MIWTDLQQSAATLLTSLAALDSSARLDILSQGMDWALETHRRTPSMRAARLNWSCRQWMPIP